VHGNPSHLKICESVAGFAEIFYPKKARKPACRNGSAGR